MMEEMRDDVVESYEVIEGGEVTEEDSLSAGQSFDSNKRQRRHQCRQCPSNFPRQTELNTHKWLVHGIFCSLLVEECPEPCCDFTCESKGLLLEHLHFTHNIDVKLVSVQLDSEAELEGWLMQFQKDNASEFAMCTTQSNAKYRTRLYTCVFESQPKRCDPHKSLRVKRQCAAHLLVKVPRIDGKGKVEILGSAHHNHVLAPAPPQDAIEEEEAVLMPQSASLFEMFQTAQQVIQLADELKGDLALENPPADHLAQVEMKLLHLKHILQTYDQPSALGMNLVNMIGPGMDEMPQVSESAVIMDGGQIEIEGDATLNDQEQVILN